VCVQVPCVYLLYTASAVTVQNNSSSAQCIFYHLDHNNIFSLQLNIQAVQSRHNIYLAVKLRFKLLAVQAQDDILSVKSWLKIIVLEPQRNILAMQFQCTYSTCSRADQCEGWEAVNTESQDWAILP
jgi:hypothetical protein